MQKIRQKLEEWGLSEAPFPEGMLTFTGHHLLTRMREDGHEAWRGYLLVAIGDEPLPRKDGQWQAITKTGYLENGEGDKPTIYIKTADDPHGSYPLHLMETVVLLPPLA